jgi:hypothetical protein
MHLNGLTTAYVAAKHGISERQVRWIVSGVAKGLRGKVEAVRRFIVERIEIPRPIGYGEFWDDATVEKAA